MARQKKTDQAPVVDLEMLEPLSDKEREFVELQIQEGIWPVEAYRRVYGTQDDKGRELEPKSVTQRAYRLSSTSRVQQYRSALYQAGAHSGILGHQEFIRDMIALADRCEAAGNYGAAVNARGHAAKASGLFVDKVQDVTETTDAYQLLDQIEELAGPEARYSAAKRLGVADEPGGEPDTRH